MNPTEGESPIYWYGPLRSLGWRDLVEEDRSALLHEAKRMKLAAGIYFAIGLILFLVPFFGWPDENQNETPFLRGLFGFGFLIGAPAFVLLGRWRWDRSVELKGQAGPLIRFEISKKYFSEKEFLIYAHQLKPLRKIFRKFNQGNSEVKIDVFHKTGIIFKINDKISKERFVLGLTAAAPHPLDAVTAPVPQKFLRNANLDVRQRHFSEAEKIEIIERVQKLKKVFLGPTIFMALLTATGIPGATQNFSSFREGPGRLYGFFFLCMAVFYRRHRKSLRRARFLLADLQRDLIFILPAQEPDGSTFEILSVSGLYWTIENQPAPWRRIK